MPAVLTTASELRCPHKAPLVVQPSQKLLTVDGHAVLVRADLLAATVPSCPNTGPGQQACRKVDSIVSGLSTTLRVGDEPVALETAKGLTLALPQPAQWQVSSVNQTKLEAI
ncbi:hypothetical protein QMK19_18085 [Streptomyces sp. H10-C2]|uniref:hypothetical protein n=1 Tax=unclassified Streptomyces TaxID=2593676 RepID=UPI0024B8D154|nr:MULTISPECIES: hypothetical protein [unclassified Streptomyces]MDJ0343462.1 hypothetical protein [Streptomyces sp. PH10-H1]MDJ0371542.1 hypothetical protein [Streptomyces sp. H10-C2]